ncbi:MAG: magnesium chelatase domain-containing protein, partial [Desulfobaccales bacterium]
MLARVKSGALKGVDAYLVEVEVDLAPGLPAFTTVGLPEAAVKESKDRVRAAVKNSGYKYPGNRITINLAPADVRKDGTGFDLPAAVGI